MKYIFALFMLVFLAGCEFPWLSDAKSKSSSTETSRVSEEAVGAQVPDDCAVVEGGLKFCAENRLSKYILYKDFDDYDNRYLAIAAQEPDLRVFTEASNYAEKQKSLCEKYDRMEARFCWDMLDNALTIEDANILFYRAMIYFEGLNGNDYEGNIVTKYLPIFEPKELIEWYYRNYAQYDADYIPDVARMYETWKRGRSEYTDYEYYLAVKSKCVEDMTEIEKDHEYCDAMQVAVADQIRKGRKDLIRIVADRQYIAALYEKH